MRVPLRRAGIAVLIGGLALVAVDVTVLHSSSPGRSADSATAGRNSAASRGGVSASQAARRGAQGGPRYFDLASSPPTPGTDGHAQASARVVAHSPVSVTGVAALPSANVHPGYSTPEDAVDGFYQALLSGSASQACAYVTDPCPSEVAGRITGMATILDAVSDGGKALVEVTGSICIAKSCAPLTDRVVMPTSPAAFSRSWTSLISGMYGFASSPLPCVQDPATRRWHVMLT